jgi:hypothetical protein
MTTKFLNAMKKLQRVVHRKEANVSGEKQEFERSKKDLEYNLKQTALILQNN